MAASASSRSKQAHLIPNLALGSTNIAKVLELIAAEG